MTQVPVSTTWRVRPRPMPVGHTLVDEYLAFLGARVRLNSWLAAAYDLKVFFYVVQEPAEVRTVGIFSFIADQRRPPHGAKVVRLEDGESGLAARTIKRRLASLSGFLTSLVAREDVDMVANPVPSGSATRRSAGQPGKGSRALIRTPRTLPRVVGPTDVSSFLDALRWMRSSGRPAHGRRRSPHLSSAPPHLHDPVTGGRHGPRGRPSPGRPPIHRVDPDLPSSG